MPNPTAMLPVSDYIKKLLFQYDCVVVPELGGFILRHLPAEFAEGMAMYLPPRKKVAFNAALKLDDGLLISYMMLHESCSREEALRHIRAFVEEIKTQIRNAGSFQLEGVGLFTHNEEGHLQFDPELRHNFLGECFGFQPVPAAAVAVPVEESVTPGETVKEEAEATVLEHPALRTVRAPYWRWVAAVLLVGSVGVMSYFTFSRVPGQLASSLNPFDLVWTVRDLSPAVQEEKPAAPVVKKIPVKAASVPVAAEPVVVKPVASAPVPSVVSAAPVIKAVPVGTPDVVKPAETLKFRYLAIAGSFSSKKNARKFQRQLRRKGYETAFIVNPEAKRGLIKVAAFGFNKRSEAEADLARIAEFTGTEAWISRN